MSDPGPMPGPMGEAQTTEALGDPHASSESAVASGGAATGAVLGAAIAGPIGLAIGAALGGVAGTAAEPSEEADRPGTPEPRNGVPHARKPIGGDGSVLLDMPTIIDKIPPRTSA